MSSPKTRLINGMTRAEYMRQRYATNEEARKEQLRLNKLYYLTHREGGAESGIRIPKGERITYRHNKISCKK